MVCLQQPASQRGFFQGNPKEFGAFDFRLKFLKYLGSFHRVQGKPCGLTSPIPYDISAQECG